MGWCVYVIECESGAWYTGVSNNVERRFNMHATGKGAKYFRMDKPVSIVATREFETKSEALSQEAVLKRLPRDAKRGWISENRYSSKTTR